MKATAVLAVGRLSDGYVVGVRGRGTLRESSTIQAFAQQVLAEGCSRLIVDLSQCDSLDSTFQGCLINLAKKHRQRFAGGFAVAAPSPECRRLLIAAHLTAVLPLLEQATTPLGHWADLEIVDVDSHTLGEHILDCHRRLAEIDRNGDKFRRVIEQLERELKSSEGL